MSEGQYVEVNGIKTYYEVHGKGEPLLLMHGGFCTVETFTRQTPEFAARYQVIVAERRGLGGEPVARELHAVPGVAGEANDRAVNDLALRLGCWWNFRERRHFLA